jgi:hypothetical protein
MKKFIANQRPRQYLDDTSDECTFGLNFSVTHSRLREMLHVKRLWLVDDPQLGGDFETITNLSLF